MRTFPGCPRSPCLSHPWAHRERVCKCRGSRLSGHLHTRHESGQNGKHPLRPQRKVMSSLDGPAVRYFQLLGRRCAWETLLWLYGQLPSHPPEGLSAPSERTRGWAIPFSDACFPVILWPRCELPWQFLQIRSHSLGLFMSLWGIKLVIFRVEILSFLRDSPG